MRYAYPIMLDVTHRHVVIVGGGAVAARKAVGLLAAGATQVACVAPAFDPAMPTAVQRIESPYQPDHLDGAGLVFAATGSAQVNQQVVEDAHARGVLACRVDSDDEHGSDGDFATPARHQQGNVILCISAGGNPALAVHIRDELARRFDPRWEAAAEAMIQLRPVIRASGLPPSRRHEIFRELAGEQALDVAAHEGATALREWIVARFPELRRP